MAVTPVNDTTWGSTSTIQNGENADNANLNRAVGVLREDVKELWTSLWGTPTTTSTATAEPSSFLLDAGDVGSIWTIPVNDFSATNLTVGEITFTWTELLNATYVLYTDDVAGAAINSTDVFPETDNSPHDYKIQQTDVDSGNALSFSNEVTITNT